MENNTNFQTFHQMGQAINDFVKQSTGRDNVQNIDIEHITVAQNHFYQDVDISGSRVSFNAGAAGLPLEKCVVQIEPVQDLHGYDHPWPGGSGNNILPMPITSGSYAYSTTVQVNDDLSFYITKVDSNGWCPFPLGTFTLAAGTYTLIESDDNSQQVAINVINTNTDTQIANTRYNKRKVFTLEEDTEVTINFSRAGAAESVLTKLMLFAGDTATANDYSPYANICPITGWTSVKVYRAGQNMEDATVFEIALPAEAGTVYGGTLDVVSGELVVDMAYELLNDPAKWVAATTGGTIDFRYQTNATDRKIYNNSYDGVKCSYALVNRSDGENTARWSGSASNIFGFKGLGLNLDQIKADAELDKISIVYELATPVTYQLTPTEITTLLGVNNIWADAGDIEVKFKDLKELY